MSGFLLGFIIALTLIVAAMILNGYVTGLDRDSSDKVVSNPFDVVFKFNWRVYRDGWKFHVLPFLRLKYKKCLDRNVKHFDIRFGWLFLFIEIDIEQKLKTC